MDHLKSAGCAIVTPVEALFIGIVGSFLANITAILLIYLKVDDAVGATCVHGKKLQVARKCRGLVIFQTRRPFAHLNCQLDPEFLTKNRHLTNLTDRRNNKGPKYILLCALKSFNHMK